MDEKDVTTNKLGMQLIQAKHWLLSVRDNLDSLSQKEMAQYEYTLLWVQLQQSVLDELEWEA